MSRSKQKGTRAENAVVDALHSVGFVLAERRALRGTNDRGDIAGVPGWVFEVKGHDDYAGKLAGWLAEAEQERINDRAQWAVVWHRRKGKSDARDWYVTMSGDQFVRLLKEFEELE